MSTSADRRRRAASGFTLLEIMLTVALLGLILPLLEARERASRMAYRSGHLLRAQAHAQRLLAQRLLDPDRARDEAGVIEEDPVFQYVITLEDYDLSTGRVVEEQDEQGFTQGTAFSETSAFSGSVPGDALPGPDELSDRQSQHRCRRLRLTLSWPSLSGDAPDQLVLEGFLPRVLDEDESAAVAAGTLK